MLLFYMYVCVCIYMFTIPLSLLLLLFRWQKHSFSSYLDFVFSGLETVLEFWRPENSHAKKFRKGENKRETWILSSDSPHLPGRDKQDTGACNGAEINRYLLQPCEQKQSCFAHHSRMHSLRFHPQCKEGKMGKQPICDAHCPRVVAPHSWEGFGTTEKEPIIPPGLTANLEIVGTGL